MPKRWSTKDPIILDAPSAESPGTAVFRFTDDYSVFHFSKMPDRIPHKGEAVGRMAAATLGMLGEAGIPNHFLGFHPPDQMKVRFFRILDPAERPLSPADGNRLVPVQVIYRNMLPAGASVFRRLAAGRVTLSDLALDKPPIPGERLPQPLIEFTSKLEEIDRFIGPAEAQALAGLDDRQFAQLRRLTLAVSSLISRRADEVGLTHADGKLEFAIDGGGEVVLVDTAGTPDENRFLRNGFHVSKQVLRDFYLPTGIEQDVQRWAAANRDRSTWPTPPRLPPWMVETVSDLYKSLAERWTGERTWGAPNLDNVIATLREFTRSAGDAQQHVVQSSERNG